MRKKFLLTCFTIIMLFCQPVVAVMAESSETSTLSEEQKTIIMDNCAALKESLKDVQREDSRTRVYLGRYYETILTKFITPLNLRLVENNISNGKLIENQSLFADKRNSFVNDFISYQQALEETINTDCKVEPDKFYEKLGVARGRRKIVNQDVLKMRQLTGEQVKLVQALGESL